MPETQLAEVKRALITLTDAVDGQTREIAALKVEVAATKELVAAWEAAKMGGKFLKWVGSLATAVAAIWLLMKVGVNQLIGGKQ